MYILFFFTPDVVLWLEYSKQNRAALPLGVLAFVLLSQLFVGVGVNQIKK